MSSELLEEEEPIWGIGNDVRLDSGKSKDEGCSSSSLLLFLNPWLYIWQSLESTGYWIADGSIWRASPASCVLPGAVIVFVGR